MVDIACVAAGSRTRLNHLYSHIQKVQSICDAGKADVGGFYKRNGSQILDLKRLKYLPKFSYVYF